MLLLFLALDENGRRLLRMLYEQYKYSMFNAAFYILKDEKLSEDAVHNAFESIAEHLYIFSDVKSARSKAYLLITVKNAAKRIYNKRKPLQDCVNIEDNDYRMSGGVDPEAVLLCEFSKQKIRQCLNDMDDKYRNILILRYYEGMSDKTIARMLGLNGSAVRKRLERARKDLIKRYRGETE